MHGVAVALIFNALDLMSGLAAVCKRVKIWSRRNCETVYSKKQVFCSVTS